jgi:hypothetical protein
MSFKLISPKKSVNSAFLKLPVPVEKMEQFQAAFIDGNVVGVELVLLKSLK